MNETNAERLATTKNAVKHAREFIDEDGELSFQYGEKVLDDFDWLIEQTERVPELEKQLHKMKALPMLMELERRKYENKKLCEALEFYANVETYKTNLVNQWEPIIPINRDSGELARQTLKGVDRNGETWS